MGHKNVLPFGKRYSFNGINLTSCDFDELYQLCKKIVNGTYKSNGLAIHFINSYTVSLTHKNMEYINLLNNNSINLIDGLPLAKAISLLYKEPIVRWRGPSFFRNTLESGGCDDVKHMLIGLTEKDLVTLVKVINANYPKANIVSAYSPPFVESFDDDETLRIINLVNQNKPTFTWIGLGTPKQDFLAHILSINCKTVAVGVGAAFDFLAGTKSEAPKWIQSIGLEWLFRLVSEPKRLWRRYLIGNSKFLLQALIEFYRKTNDK